MTHAELYARLSRFAERVTRFALTLLSAPRTASVADQLMGAANGAAANSRASNHGRTNAEFRSKLGIAVEEADETRHWLAHLQTTGLATGIELAGLLQESIELTKILGASKRTANRNARAPTPIWSANTARPRLTSLDR